MQEVHYLDIYLKVIKKEKYTVDKMESINGEYRVNLLAEL